jgi:protein-serine/threonine kinase
MRDSKSVDLERNDDIIHATATSPSAFIANGEMTPGILTPKELTDNLSPELPTAGGGRSRSGSAKSTAREEVNPFGDFSSVTRDIGDWQ